jgi:large subunit ribosomal protein L22
MLNNLKKRDRYEFYYLNQVKKRDGVYALGQYIPMSVDKARRVIDQIRGRSYEESLMILELMPYRACYPILKLIYSAAANGSHNKGFNKADLLITKAEVNKGTTMKKLKPRARGRSYMIKRPTCHITIVLKDMSYLKGFREYITTFPLKGRQELMAATNSNSKFGIYALRLLQIGEMDWEEPELD